MPTRHKNKRINWKEMYAILYAFTIWHEHWHHGAVDIACDSWGIVNGVNNRTIDGAPIRPLRVLLLIAAHYDINIKAHWIPTEENVIADAASRHDFKKLADLGFQEQVKELRGRLPTARISNLRRELLSFYNYQSRQAQGATTILPDVHMKDFAL